MNYEILELRYSEKLRFYVVLALLGLVIGWLFYDSLIFGVVAAICLFSLKGEYVRSLKQRRKDELLLQFRDLLYSLASAVSTGRSIRQGLIDSMSFWQGTYSDDDYIMLELKSMTSKMEQSNIQDIAVLEDFAKRSGIKDVEDVVMVCNTCKKSGGNLPAALEKCSNIIGDKIDIERELQVIVSQKKFEGRIVAIAPFALLFLIRVISPEYLLPLTQTSTGRMVSTISLVLIAIAWVYIERVNSIEI